MTAMWAVALTVAFTGLALLYPSGGPLRRVLAPSGYLSRSDDPPASVPGRARPYGSHLIRSRVHVPGVRLSLCAVSVLETHGGRGLAGGRLVVPQLVPA